DGRADQFAWGVMAYEILAGSRPWRATDPLPLAMAVLNEAPRPLPEVAPEVSREVAAVVHPARARDAAARLPGMGALLGELQAAPTLSGRSAVAPPAASSEPPASGPTAPAASHPGGTWPRRGVVASIALAGLASLVAITWQVR